VRHEEVRQHSHRRSQRQGHHAVRVAQQTQERTRQNEAKLGEHDQKLGQVDQKVQAADTKAAQAGTAAQDAAKAAQVADQRAQAIETSAKRLVYEVVLSDDNSKFEFGKTKLADDTRAELDKVVQQLTADPKNVYLEIEGHTDSVGNTAMNERLGMERAEAVKRYLYEQHNIPLHKMNVISYGETKPVAPNNTKDGRAKNRRVVIKVLT